MSGETMVQIALDDLCSLKSSADVSQIYKKERDDVQKKLNDANLEKDDLAARLAQWTAAVNATKPEKDAHAFLAEHDTPFEARETDDACKIIRALLAQAHTKTPEVTA